MSRQPLPDVRPAVLVRRPTLYCPAPLGGNSKVNAPAQPERPVLGAIQYCCPRVAAGAAARSEMAHGPVLKQCAQLSNAPDPAVSYVRPPLLNPPLLDVRQSSP